MGRRVAKVSGSGRNYYNQSVNARVSEKGQVTIPKKLRDRLGISPGQVLSFSEEGGRLVATKQRNRDGLDEVFGILHAKIPDVDRFIEEVRGPADRA
ncbi:MAG TPA: AbrB/MazE/SpoVT family DNA-binding domain-containing protein [Chloroflexota bacterium]|jgi:AbrB family looped-hinge helix DNA binding protein|nr:AbrB/MazE/SpoVT family DNA-binding domain-containing protein [Chloroflexota bacterium]